MITIDGVVFKLQRAGGISVYFNELVKRLIAGNHDFSYLDYTGCKSMEQSTSRQMRWLERYRDVHQIQGGVFHSSYYRVCLQPDVRNVTTVHDFTYEKFSNGPSRLIHSWQKNRAIRNSKAVICISENTKKDLLEYLPDIDPSRIFVIHNGVSDVYQPIANSVRCDYVLYVGARGGYKNFKNAVIALSGCADINLIVVGGGVFKECELGFLNHYLPGRYSHAGFVADSQLNVLYNEALCLLYPSLYEGFGIPVLEAMRAGCPVVAVNASSIPEVAGTSALLVEDASPEKLSSAISFMRSEKNSLKYRAAGLIHVKQFSWDATFQKTMEVYQHVIGL